MTDAEIVVALRRATPPVTPMHWSWPVKNNDVEKITVKLEKHPNADALSIVRVGDFQVVVRTADWKDGDEAAYIYPDALVDTAADCFAFLRKGNSQWHRVRAIKLRGERSFGLLVPWRDDLPVKHWNPPEEGEPQVPGQPKQRDPGLPGPSVPKYDLENGRRWGRVFTPGEPVTVTEKLHGANARYCYTEEFGFQCGSRTRWLPPGDTTPPAAVVTPEIEALCRALPGWVLFGEAYGFVGGFPYDGKKFRAFDLWDTWGNRWANGYELLDALTQYSVPTVPLLYSGPYDPEVLKLLAEGPTTLGSHVREGVVVAASSRRLKQKWVGFGYLEGK